MKRLLIIEHIETVRNSHPIHWYRYLYDKYGNCILCVSDEYESDLKYVSDRIIEYYLKDNIKELVHLLIRLNISYANRYIFKNI
jgi:hypothetical protein